MNEGGWQVVRGYILQITVNSIEEENEKLSEIKSQVRLNRSNHVGTSRTRVFSFLFFFLITISMPVCVKTQGQK